MRLTSLRMQVLYALFKREGRIESHNGRSVLVLRRLMGYTGCRQTLYHVLKRLEEEGYIRRDIGETRTYSIELIKPIDDILHFRVLDYLYAHGGKLTDPRGKVVSILAAELGVSSKRVSTTLYVLRRRGLIKMQPGNHKGTRVLEIVREAPRFRLAG